MCCEVAGVSTPWGAAPPTVRYGSTHPFGVCVHHALICSGQRLLPRRHADARVHTRVRGEGYAAWQWRGHGPASGRAVGDAMAMPRGNAQGRRKARTRQCTHIHTESWHTLVAPRAAQEGQAASAPQSHSREQGRPHGRPPRRRHVREGGACASTINTAGLLPTTQLQQRAAVRRSLGQLRVQRCDRGRAGIAVGRHGDAMRRFAELRPGAPCGLAAPFSLLLRLSRGPSLAMQHQYRRRR